MTQRKTCCVGLVVITAIVLAASNSARAIPLIIGKGEAVDLSAGTHRFDHIDILGGTLNLLGDVTLNVTNDVNIQALTEVFPDPEIPGHVFTQITPARINGRILGSGQAGTNGANGSSGAGSGGGGENGEAGSDGQANQRMTNLTINSDGNINVHNSVINLTDGSFNPAHGGSGGIGGDGGAGFSVPNDELGSGGRGGDAGNGGAGGDGAQGTRGGQLVINAGGELSLTGDSYTLGANGGRGAQGGRGGEPGNGGDGGNAGIAGIGGNGGNGGDAGAGGDGGTGGQAGGIFLSAFRINTESTFVSGLNAFGGTGGGGGEGGDLRTGFANHLVAGEGGDGGAGFFDRDFGFITRGGDGGNAGDPGDGGNGGSGGNGGQIVLQAQQIDDNSDKNVSGGFGGREGRRAGIPIFEPEGGEGGPGDPNGADGSGPDPAQDGSEGSSGASGQIIVRELGTLPPSVGNGGFSQGTALFRQSGPGEALVTQLNGNSVLEMSTEDGPFTMSQFIGLGDGAPPQIGFDFNFLTSNSGSLDLLLGDTSLATVNQNGLQTSDSRFSLQPLLSLDNGFSRLIGDLDVDAFNGNGFTELGMRLNPGSLAAVQIDNLTFNPQGGPVRDIPEPATLMLFTTGLAGLWLARRRSRVGGER